MRAGWKTTSIGEVCDLVNGGTPATNVSEFWGGAHRWITPAEMGKRASPYVDETARTLSDQGLASCSATMMPPFSVILSSRAPIGHLVINTRPMATNQGCKGLIPHGNLHYKFLYYNLLSNVELLNNLGTGATFKELSGGKLKEVAIPLPPLEEQKRIVAILDEAFEGLDRAAANAKKNLANARELFDSHLNAVFTQEGEGWIEKPLGDLVKIKHGFAFKSEYFTSSGDYVLLTPGNFFEKGGYRDRGQKQKYYAGPLPDGYILEEGDMLLAMTEQAPGLLGSPLIVPVANRFLHNQRLGLIQVKEGAAWCGKFFAHLFNSSKFRSRVHSDASGVKVRHSSPEKICAVTVSFPTSLPVQVSIAERLNDLRDETERLQELYVEKSAAVASLKQSILQKAFAGELTTAMDLAA